MIGMTPKKQGMFGLLIALVFALPLFVLSTMNVNFNVQEQAQEELVESLPKGGNENYDYLINSSPIPIIDTSPNPFTTVIPQSTALENQFFTKHAMYVFAAFLVFVITTMLFYQFKIRKSNIQ